MDYSGLRAEARKRLSGKWGKVVLLTLVLMIISGLLSYLPTLAKAKTYTTIDVYGFSVPVETVKDTPISLILLLVCEVVAVVFSFGTILAMWKVYKGEDVAAFDGVKLAISNWKRGLMLLLQTVLKLLIPIILIVVAMVLTMLNVVLPLAGILTLVGGIWAFIEGLYYSLVYVVAADEPNLPETEVVTRSKELMNNKRGKLVVLALTFIGWAILAALTFGIGTLWLLPYMEFAVFAFYEVCKGGAPVNSQPVSEENTNM